MYKLVTDQCHTAMWRWGFAGSSVLVGNGKFVVSRNVSVKSVVIVNLLLYCLPYLYRIPLTMQT